MFPKRVYLSYVFVTHLFFVFFLNLNKLLPSQQLKKTQIYYFSISMGQELMSRFIGCSELNPTRLLVSNEAHTSSKAQGLLTSLVVGRIQFLATISLRSSAPGGCPSPCLWLSLQHGSLLVQMQMLFCLCALGCLLVGSPDKDGSHTNIFLLMNL